MSEIESAARTTAEGTERGKSLSEMVENVETAVRGLCRRRLGRKPEVVVIPHTGRLQ